MSSMIDQGAFSRLMRSTRCAGVSFTGVSSGDVSAGIAVGPVMSQALERRVRPLSKTRVVAPQRTMWGFERRATQPPASTPGNGPDEQLADEQAVDVAEAPVRGG